MDMDYSGGMNAGATDPFVGRAALVTGAGTGIGRATARALTGLRARVVAGRPERAPRAGSTASARCADPSAAARPAAPFN